MSKKVHWETIYRCKPLDELSWTQAEARLSYELITRAEPQKSASIIDVGGGSSVLVDALNAAGYHRLTVLDLAGAALERSRSRLSDSADRIEWREEDILKAQLLAGQFDLWHDRAVFHFLTDKEERQRYLAQVRHALRPQGHVVMATFADDGPMRCSGLEVARYSAQTLHDEFGADFRLLSSVREEHLTPWGARQVFLYCLCRYEPLT